MFSFKNSAHANNHVSRSEYLLKISMVSHSLVPKEKPEKRLIQFFNKMV